LNIVGSGYEATEYFPGRIPVGHLIRLISKTNLSAQLHRRNTVDVSMYFETLNVVSLVEVASYTVSRADVNHNRF